MKRTTKRTRLVIRRETLRRLVADDLVQVAGGRFNNNWCTYAASGCQGGPTGGCLSEDCTDTVKCETQCCL